MRNSTRCVLLAIPLSMITVAHGGGFQVNPTASVVARAMGGNGIVGEEVGDMFFNPASLSLNPYNNTLQLGATLIELGNDFVDQGSVATVDLGAGPVNLPLQGTNRGSDDAGTPLGIFYADQVPWNEDITYGIGLTTPWGLSTTYEHDWIGRYHTVATELRVIDLNLAASMRINSRLLVGAGISLQSARATLIQAAPVSLTEDERIKIEGNDSAIGFNLGLIFSPSEEIKLGLSFRSKMEHDLGGYRRDKLGETVEKVGSVAPVSLPESLYLSLHYQPSGQPWSIAFGSRRTAWHRFDELRVDYDDQSPSTVVQQNWDDSWTTGISFDYLFDGGLKGIISVGYDEAPTPDSIHRSAQVPSFDRKILGLGLELNSSFGLCTGCSAYFGYQRAFTADRSIDNTNQLSDTFAATLSGFYEGGHFDVFSGHFIISF